MNWWGKLLGGTFGFMLGGPIGALFGAAIGHSFDTGLDKNAATAFGTGTQERVQMAFFTATFSIMGHVAKADGKVTEHEINLARSIMDQMRLTAEQKRAAMNLFNQGKQTDFPVNEVMDQFRKECHRRHTLIQMFIEIQLHAAYADGVVHSQEKRILLDLSHQLGFSATEFDHLEAMVRAQRFFEESDTTGGSAKTNDRLLKQAYAVLAVDANSDQATIKKAYRRLMNQHHPDKLVAKGLPEEMIKLATDKTHEIRKAYETIKGSRGFH